LRARRHAHPSGLDDDPRSAGTVKAVEAELVEDGLVRR
jgi:hypothetical protein